MNSKKYLIVIILKIFLLPLILICQSKKNDTIYKRFNPPDGYERLQYPDNSFAEWIRHIPLKPVKSDVLDFQGKIFKNKNDTTVAAITDYTIKGKRLEQCMDILVRFYAEYLWETGQITELQLPLPGGQFLKWQDWKQGYRPQFKGIQFELNKLASLNSSKSNFNRFLNMIFAESGTQQFYYSLPKVEKNNINVGDFIVKKGTKGHAVMIVDLAKNTSGELIALIGQGDTPACEFYILNYQSQKPWVPIDFLKKCVSLPIKKKMCWDGLRRFK